MAPILVLIGSILAFRGIGAFGVEVFDTWPAAVRFGLAVMLAFTASAHFTRMKEDLIRMTPAWVPNPSAMVTFTGVCEILGAIGIVLPRFQTMAGIALILLFIALLPANVHAANAGVTLRGKPVTPIVMRIPMQLLFIGLTWWATQ
jgi:uncharacterized membrane protein